MSFQRFKSEFPDEFFHLSTMSEKWAFEIFFHSVFDSKSYFKLNLVLFASQRSEFVVSEFNW